MCYKDKTYEFCDNNAAETRWQRSCLAQWHHSGQVLTLIQTRILQVRMIIFQLTLNFLNVGLDLEGVGASL